MATIDELSEALGGITSLFASLSQQLSSALGAVTGVTSKMSGVSSALTQTGGAIVAMGQQLATATSAVAGFVGRLSAAAMQASKALVDPFVKLSGLIVAPIVGSVATVVGALASLVAGLLSSAVAAILESSLVQGAVIPALGALASALGVALVPLLALAGALLAVVAVIGSAVVVALTALAAAVLAVAAALAAPFLAAAALFTAALTALTAPLVATGAAAALATGPFLAVGAAARAVTAPFQMLGNALGPFVSALNPSAMEAFNFALKGLQATIGVALLPVIQVFTTSMRNVAGALLPLMQQMSPVLGKLAQALSGVLLVAVQVIADAFVALMPLVQLAVDLFSSLAEGFRVFLIVVRTLIQTVAAMFGGADLKNISEQFRKVLLEVVKYFVLFAAQIARLLNSLGFQNNFVNDLMKNLGQVIQPKQGGAAPAPSDVGIKGFEQIGKDMAVAAFAAQGAGAAEAPKEIDYLKDMKGLLEDLNRNGKDAGKFFEDLGQKIENALARAGDAAKQWGEARLNELKQEVERWIQDVKAVPGHALEAGMRSAQSATAGFLGPLAAAAAQLHG